MYNELPPIDLMIRTSGELRLSNFMMYQASYAEFYFPNVFFITACFLKYLFITRELFI